MIFNKHDSITPEMLGRDQDLITTPVGGYSVIQHLMTLPYTEAELSFYTEQPISQIEKDLGLEPGEYTYARDFPRVMARARRLLAEAIAGEIEAEGARAYERWEAARAANAGLVS